MLARHTGGNPCTPLEQDQALHALNELGRPENADQVDDEMPILTQTSRLLPVGKVLFRDNPVLATRITDADVHYANSAISGRAVIEKLRRLSDAVTEELSEEPMLSADAQINAHCRRLQDLICSRQFLLAIQRLVGHERGYPVLDYKSPLQKVEVLPAIAIYTNLLLNDHEGERPVGAAELEFFVRSTGGTDLDCHTQARGASAKACARRQRVPERV